MSAPQWEISVGFVTQHPFPFPWYQYPYFLRDMCFSPPLSSSASHGVDGTSDSRGERVSQT